MLGSVSSKKVKTIRDKDIQLYSLAAIVSGTLSTIANRTLGVKYKYKHGTMITFLIFVGEYLNYIPLVLPLICSKKRRREHFEALQDECVEHNKKITGGYIFFALPGFFDVMATSFINVAMLLLPASILQTLLGGSIITASIVSRIMIGRTIDLQQGIGIFLATAGFLLAGLSSCLHELIEYQPDLKRVFLGIILIVLALFSRGILSNTEELLFLKYSISAGRAAAIEGFFGIVWVFFFMVILSFFGCPQSDICDMGSFMEDPVLAFKEILSDPHVLKWSIVMTLSAIVANFSIVSLTKEASCIYASFCAALNTIFIWIFSLLLGLEETSTATVLTQVGSYCLLLLGNCFYNRLIKVPFKASLSRPKVEDVRSSIA